MRNIVFECFKRIFKHTMTSFGGEATTIIDKTNNGGKFNL